MKLPAHFLMNISVNKILFAVESNNCGLSFCLQWSQQLWGIIGTDVAMFSPWILKAWEKNQVF